MLIAACTKDCSNTILVANEGRTRFWANRAGANEIAEHRRQRCCSPAARPVKQAGRPGLVALAKLMQKAAEDFVILGDQEKCCGLHTYDLGFSA